MSGVCQHTAQLHTLRSPIMLLDTAVDEVVLLLMTKNAAQITTIVCLAATVLLMLTDMLNIPIWLVG